MINDYEDPSEEPSIYWPSHHKFPIMTDRAYDSINTLCLDKSTKFPLFRYTKRKYFDEFIETGKIRLNTLFYFTDHEKLHPKIGDKFEGQVIFNARENDGHIDGMPVMAYGSSVNRYLLSLSSDRVSEFENMVEYDCCFEVNSFQFFIEIAKACRDNWFVGWVGPVHYIAVKDLLRPHLKGESILPLVQVKDPFLCSQKEVRFWLEPYPVLETKGNNDEIMRNFLSGDHKSSLKFPGLHPLLEPIDILAPSAAKFCRIVWQK